MTQYQLFDYQRITQPPSQTATGGLQMKKLNGVFFVSVLAVVLAGASIELRIPNSDSISPVAITMATSAEAGGSCGPGQKTYKKKVNGVRITAPCSAYTQGELDAANDKFAYMTWQEKVDALSRVVETPSCPAGTIFRYYKADGRKIQTPIIFGRSLSRVPFTGDCPKCREWGRTHGGFKTAVKARENTRGACLPPGEWRWCRYGRTFLTLPFGS